MKLPTFAFESETERWSRVAEKVFTVEEDPKFCGQFIAKSNEKHSFIAYGYHE